MKNKEKDSKKESNSEQIIDKKENPFSKKFNEDLPMWSFELDPKFIGIHEELRSLGDGEKSFNVHIMSDIKTGERFYIPAVYTINKTIEGAKSENNGLLSSIVFQFEYKGKTELNGKPFNKFDTAFCTIKEYEYYYQ